MPAQLLRWPCQRRLLTLLRLRQPLRVAHEGLAVRALPRLLGRHPIGRRARCPPQRQAAACVRRNRLASLLEVRAGAHPSRLADAGRGLTYGHWSHRRSGVHGAGWTLTGLLGDGDQKGKTDQGASAGDHSVGRGPRQRRNPGSWSHVRRKCHRNHASADEDRRHVIHGWKIDWWVAHYLRMRHADVARHRASGNPHTVRLFPCPPPLGERLRTQRPGPHSRAFARITNDDCDGDGDTHWRVYHMASKRPSAGTVWLEGCSLDGRRNRAIPLLALCQVLGALA